MRGLGRLGLGMSKPSTGSTPAVGSLDPTISAPVLTLATGNLVYPPQLDAAIDDTAQVGDAVRLQWADDSGFTTNLNSVSNTIDSTEASAHAASFTGLSSIASGTHRFRARVERGIDYGAWSNTIIQGPDDVAPTLSAPTSASVAATTAIIGCTTDEANGTLYAVLTTNNSAPSKAQVKAGQMSTGSAATYAGSQAISSTGAKTLNATGLTASTNYYAWFMHEDSTGNQSLVLDGSDITTTAPGSVAKLVIGSGATGAGATRSQYINSTDGYTATMNNSVGAACLIESTDIPPTKFHFEVTFAAGARFYIGVTDSADALGASVFTNPGDASAQKGFTARFDTGNGTSQSVYRNGGSATLTVPSTPATGLIVALDVDTSTNSIWVSVKISGSVTVLNSGSAYVLSSQIPTNWRAFVGGSNTPDSCTANFGASAWAITPRSGHTGW